MTIAIYDIYVDARNLISAMMSLKGQLELPILVTAKSNSWPLGELSKLRNMHFYLIIYILSDGTVITVCLKE